MSLLGQASGGWTESSSALRLLNVGIRNSIGVLTEDSFTQANPPLITTAGTISTRVNTTKAGILSGSVCFTRPHDGENYVGGVPTSTAGWTLLEKKNFKALGCFINSANGNAFENLPGVASGIGPYVSAMGTYGNALYETQVVADAGGADPTVGTDLLYVAGAALIASKNGYLMPRWQFNNAGNALVDLDVVAMTAESYVAAAAASATTIGLLKMAPDPVQAELVYDQRI